MYKRTPLGDNCKHLLDKDENICKHICNKQPTSIGYSENGCRYSYCPLEDKHYYFGDICTKCNSLAAIGTGEYTVCSCNLF